MAKGNGQSEQHNNGLAPGAETTTDTDLCHALHRLTNTAAQDDPETLYAECLAAGCKLFGLDTAMLGRVEGGSYRVLAVHERVMPFSAGQSLPLSDFYCHQVVKKSCTHAVTNVGQHPILNLYPFYQSTGFECYLGAPIWVDGVVYGVLGFFGNTARTESFTQQQQEAIELLAWGLGRVIERRELERRCTRTLLQLRENIDLFESAFQFAPIGKALVAPDGRMLRVNRAFSGMVGYTEAELCGMNFQGITHAEDLELDLALLQETLDGQRAGYHLEKRYLHRDGHIVWVLLSVSVVRSRGGDPRYLVAQVQDISEQKRIMDELYRKRYELEVTNRELQSLATKDPLTQLMNRRGFYERFYEELNKAQRSQSPISLLVLDVDHFKSYNDTYGHPAGDVALQRISDVLRSNGRGHDVVARHGGEEFAVILPNTDAAGCGQTAERIRQAVADMDNGELHREFTISIGCATAEVVASDCEDTAEQLLRLADKALYAAKAVGRNRVRHSNEGESSR